MTMVMVFAKFVNLHLICLYKLVYILAQRIFGQILLSLIIKFAKNVIPIVQSVMALFKFNAQSVIRIFILIPIQTRVKDSAKMDFTRIELTIHV